MWYFILGIVVAWLVFNHVTKKRLKESSDAFIINKDIDEDTLQERQQRFEDFMVYSTVPTALYADARAMYFEMKNWFVRLDERSAHDKERQQQIRKDWLNYLYQLDHGASAHYLSLEFDDERRRGRESEAREAAIRVNEIEDRFASMIGPEAEERVKEIRKKGFSELMEEENNWRDHLRMEQKKAEK